MDKYEFKIKADEIKDLIAKKKYADAMAIADGIDWRKVKSVIMLCTISDLYKMNRKYEESKELLLLAYERHPSGRMIVYSLCELCIKMENPVEAIEYYKEFVQIAPRDSGRYILQYKLYESQEVSLEERIAVLEEFKKREYRPKWAYELAYLYHRVGLSTKCVEECDQLILWFGEGRFVTKAMELKMLHQPLTEDQEIKYTLATGKALTPQKPSKPVSTDTKIVNRIRKRKEEVPQEPLPEEEPEIKVRPVNVGEYATINLQRELAESMREIFPQANSQQENFQQGDFHQEMENDLERETEEKVVVETEDENTDFAETDMDVNENDFEETEPDSEEIFFVEKDTAEIQQDQTLPVYQSEPESAFSKILSQEYDGQISLVVPETGTVERQITGQMNIQDILNEWERMKKETGQKQENDLKQKILEQTGAMFTEFDVASRTGVLAQLEEIEESDNEAIAKIVDYSKYSVKKEEGERPLEGESTKQSTEQSKEEYNEQYEEEYEEQPVGQFGEEYSEQYEEEYEEQSIEQYGEQSEEAVEETAPEIIVSDAIEIAKETDYDEVEELTEIETYPEEEISATEVYTKKLMAEDDDEVKDSTVELPKVQEAETGKKYRTLTDDEKELFATFMQTKEMKQQLMETLDTISLAAYTGNVIITGEVGSGTVELARNLIKEIRQTDSNFSGKIARIYAKLLNSKNIEHTLSKLVNGALIIEKASELKPETVTKLNKALEQEKSGIIVILEDRKKDMDRFLEENHALSGNFNARIDIEALDNNALVEYGKSYAESLEYSIDEMGVLALYTRIADMQTSEHIATVGDVKELIDRAIENAGKKNMKHLMDLLFAKRYDSNDMIVLRERDFIVKES